MKGSLEQAITYCKKDGDFYERGTYTKKGQRSDLLEIKKKIDSGTSYDQLWEEDFSVMLQYRKGFQEYMNLKSSRTPREQPRVFVFWGSTGTGKTRRAWAINQESTWVYPGKGWFDGYTGQEVAIFDEFDGSDIKFSFWKQLVDRYRVAVPIKGGFSNWCPKFVIFTSNLEPGNWWRDEQLPMGSTDQFSRRVERVELMNTEWTPEVSEPLNFI